MRGVIFCPVLESQVEVTPREGQTGSIDSHRWCAVNLPLVHAVDAYNVQSSECTVVCMMGSR